MNGNRAANFVPVIGAVCRNLDYKYTTLPLEAGKTPIFKTSFFLKVVVSDGMVTVTVTVLPYEILCGNETTPSETTILGNEHWKK